MQADFKDHFSDKSADYNRFRPTYPADLFTHLASIAPARDTAWDCATGSGQSAVALADYFRSVIATDASANQINNAVANARVTYKVEPAERTSLAAESIDLITVAQALHWFDLAAFAHEVVRVLRPDGVLAAWSYGLFTISTELDRLVQYLYADILDPYWPPERRLVEQAYQNIQFAQLRMLSAPTFQMQARWTYPQLLGYLNTWSAVKICSNSVGKNPLTQISDELAGLWGPAEHVRQVSWPLILRLWQK